MSVCLSLCPPVPLPTVNGKLSENYPSTATAFPRNVQWVRCLTQEPPTGLFLSHRDIKMFIIFKPIARLILPFLTFYFLLLRKHIERPNTSNPRPLVLEKKITYTLEPPMGLFCPIWLLAMHFFASRRISVHFWAFLFFLSHFMLEKTEETKVHVLIDLSGRIRRKDGRIGSRKDGYWAGWRRRCVFTDVPSHTPLLQTGNSRREEIFSGVGSCPGKIFLGYNYPLTTFLQRPLTEYPGSDCPCTVFARISALSLRIFVRYRSNVYGCNDKLSKDIHTSTDYLTRICE